MVEGNNSHGSREMRDVMDALCITEAAPTTNESAASFIEGVRTEARHTVFPEVRIAASLRYLRPAFSEEVLLPTLFNFRLVQEERHGGG